MSLKNAISEHIKTLMKARQLEEVKILRNVQAVIKQIEIDRQIVLSDIEILDILQKQIKQRQESLAIFVDNGRDDLANKERLEIETIHQFLPEPLADDELKTIITNTISELGASSISDMGKVVNAVKQRVAGRADPAIIAQFIKQALQSN